MILLAAEALGRYKLRTSLSVLGVILGVAAVITMMSVSEGARAQALRQVELLGLDNVVARNRGVTAGEVTRPRHAGLTAGDAQHVADLVPLTRAVSPLVERYLPLSYGGRRQPTRILGVRASYQTILRLRVDRGRFLSSLDDQMASRVCVLGASIARLLFEYGEPIGRQVRVDTGYYEVVGVLAEQGTDLQTPDPLARRDFGQALLVPLPALLGRNVEITPATRVDEIVACADGPAAIPITDKNTRAAIDGMDTASANAAP